MKKRHTMPTARQVVHQLRLDGESEDLYVVDRQGLIHEPRPRDLQLTLFEEGHATNTPALGEPHPRNPPKQEDDPT